MPLSMTTAGREVGSIVKRKEVRIVVVVVVTRDPQLRSERRVKAMEHDREESVGDGDIRKT